MPCNLFILCINIALKNQNTVRHGDVSLTSMKACRHCCCLNFQENSEMYRICPRPCLFKHFYLLFHIRDCSYSLIKWTLNFSNYVGVYSCLNCQIQQHSTITKLVLLVNYWMAGKGLARWVIQQHFNKNIQLGHLCQFSKYPKVPLTPKLLLSWHRLGHNGKLLIWWQCRIRQERFILSLMGESCTDCSFKKNTKHYKVRTATNLSTVLHLHIAIEFSPAIFVSLCTWQYLCFITASNL